MTPRLGNGDLLAVGDRIGSGADGTVYDVTSPSGLVFKHFDKAGNEELATLRSRLEMMVQRRPTGWRTEQAGHVVLAWPKLLVFEGKHFLGFVMPRVDLAHTAELHMVSNPSDRRAPSGNVPSWLRDWNWEYLLQTASNLAHVTKVVHDEDYVIGDFNERNALVWRDARITLVDCDSMQVTGPDGTQYFTAKGRPEFTAPELLGVDLATTRRAPSSDLFALAVHVYQLLMEGVHPFDGVWKGSGDKPRRSKLAATGMFVHADQAVLVPPPKAVPFDFLPRSLQVLFQQAFVDGQRDPRARPSGERWRTALDAVAADLKTCSLKPSHRYPAHNTSCLWCRREDTSRDTKRTGSARTTAASTTTRNDPGASKPIVGSRRLTSATPTTRPQKAATSTKSTTSTTSKRPAGTSVSSSTSTSTSASTTSTGRTAPAASRTPLTRAVFSALTRPWALAVEALAVAAACLLTVTDLPRQITSNEDFASWLSRSRPTVLQAALLVDPTRKTPAGVVGGPTYFDAPSKIAVWCGVGLIVSLVVGWGLRRERPALAAGLPTLALVVLVMLPWGTGQQAEDARLERFVAGGIDGACRGVDSIRPHQLLWYTPAGDVTSIVSYCPDADGAFVTALDTDRTGTDELWRVRVADTAGQPQVVAAVGEILVVRPDGSSADHLLGLQTGDGTTAWAIPCPALMGVEEAWYFPPDATPETLASQAIDIVYALGSDDDVSLINAVDSDPNAILASVRDRYGLPDLTGQILIDCVAFGVPGQALIADVASGTVTAAATLG